MLLVIHNLPTKILYKDLKVLIRERCGLTDIILDNLDYETPQSRKVTVGLTDENEAALLFKELNGLDIMGRKLFVEDMRQRKSASNIMYSGNKMRYEQTSNIIEAQKNIPGMQTMPKSFSTSMNAHGIQYNVPDNQGTYKFRAALTQDTNRIMMQTHSTTSYNRTVPGMYGVSNMSMIQNTSTAYRGSSSFGNNQQRMINSNDSQPDFISLSGEKSLNDSRYNNPGGSKYFQVKDDKQKLTFNNRQSFGTPAPGSRDRNRRMPPVRNEREGYAPSNRSNVSNERRFDVWNRSDDFSKRSDGGNSRLSDKNTIRRESFSNRNQRQAGEPYNRSYDGTYRGGPERKLFDDESSRRLDSAYNISTKCNTRRFVNDFNSHHDESSMHKYGNHCPYEQSCGQTNVSRFKRMGSRGKNDSLRDFAIRKVGDSQSHGSKHTPNKFLSNQSHYFKKSSTRSNTVTQSSGYPKTQQVSKPLSVTSNMARKTTKLDSKYQKVKQITWRNQAAAAIAKKLLADCSKSDLVQNIKLLTFLKAKISSRITEMIGKRTCVPLRQIFEEYNNNFRPGSQRAFLNNVINEFEVLRAEQVLSPIKDFNILKESDESVDMKGVKRVATDTLAKKANVLADVPLQQQLPHPEPLPDAGVHSIFKPLQECGPSQKRKRQRKRQRVSNQDQDEGNLGDANACEEENAGDGEDFGDEQKDYNGVKKVLNDSDDVKYVDDNDDIICIAEDMTNVKKKIINDSEGNKTQTNNAAKKPIAEVSNDNESEKSVTNIKDRIEDNASNVLKDIENYKEQKNEHYNPDVIDANEMNPDDIDMANISQDDLEDF